MKAKIVSVSGHKGGIGKSTVAINLAAEAVARGLRTLLVDADPQASILTWHASAARVTGQPLPTVVAMGADLHRADQLPQFLPAFDLVVIDGPAKLGDVQRAALWVADLAIFPCGPSAFEAWALGDSLSVLEAARQQRPELDAALLITRSQPRTALGRQAREMLQQTGVPVLKTTLAYRITYQEAAATGKSVSAYAPASEASREVRNLFDEVWERMAPAVAQAPASTVKPKAASKARVKKAVSA